MDGVDICGGEEEICEDFAGRFVVEEGEETPVEKPCAVLELGEWVVEEGLVDHLFDFGDFFHSGFPFGGEDFAGELSPCCRGRFLLIRGLS